MELLRTHAFWNGRWQSTAADFTVVNPFDGSRIASVADCGPVETTAAIAAAHAAFPAWAARPAAERSRLLLRWNDLLLEHLDDLALLLTTEQGKPLAEARGEIRYAAGFLEWFAEEGKRTYGDVVPPPSADKRITVIKQPVGVCAIITPWNFPAAMITRKVGAALAVGCTVVVKPAEDTPLTALALAALGEEAGLPAGVLNVVPTSRPVEVGRVLTDSPLVRKLSFTGSTPVGRQLMEQCAGTLKRLSLELGGNAPFIVFDDADLDAAVVGLIASKFRNAGQTCVCANRVYVHTGIYDAFVERLLPAVRALTVGNGATGGTDIGPLINQAGLDKVSAIVEDAVTGGADLLLGGHPAPAAGPCGYAPTVLGGVTRMMRVHTEEIFGPVIPLFPFTTEAEVIELANDTPYGLAAYFYGRDYVRCWRVAEALDYGMVGVNTGAISTPVAPFGGVKASGFGREGGRYGVEEYLTIKYLGWGGIRSSSADHEVAA